MTGIHERVFGPDHADGNVMAVFLLLTKLTLLWPTGLIWIVDTETEIVWTQLELHCIRSKPVLIGAFYRHPRPSSKRQRA